MGKIRILHIVPNMQSGGLETFIMNVYRNINRENVQFDFLVHYKEKNFYDDEIQSLGGKIYRLTLRDDNNLIKYISDLNKFFRTHTEYKVVHCHMASVGFLVFLIAKKYGVKVRIAHSHNSNTEKTLKGVIKKILVKLLKYTSTQNFACSKSAGKFLFGNKNFEVIPNGIDLKKFKYDEKTREIKRKELNLEKKFVIGHVGRFCNQKNHEFLIKVFYEVHKKNKNTVLILIGNGELEQKIKDKVDKLNLTNDVMFLGARKDVNELYQAMDLFLFPSKFEGLGIVLVEAQVSGLSIICSDSIPNEVNITDNIQKLKLDVKQWTNAVLNIDKNYRKKIDKRIDKFDIKKISSNLENKYIEYYK